MNAILIGKVPKGSSAITATIAYSAAETLVRMYSAASSPSTMPAASSGSKAAISKPISPAIPPTASPIRMA